MKVALVLLFALALAFSTPAADAGRRHLLQGAPQGPKPTPATPAATAPGTPAKPQPAPAATAKPAPVAPKAPGNATAPAGKTIPTAGPGGKRNATGNATAAGQGARINFDMGDEAAFEASLPKEPIAPKQPFARGLLSQLAAVVAPRRWASTAWA